MSSAASPPGRGLQTAPTPPVDPLDFSGRVVLVTGAAHGIGRGVCEAFAGRGATVWGCDVLEGELAETVRRCRAAGGTAHGRVVDATEGASVEEFVKEIGERDGAVDVLVHAAGGVQYQLPRPVETVSLDDWRRIVAVNLDGAFLFVRAVVPGMKARRFGRIVTISSGAGRSYSQTGIQAYAGAKAGLIGFTRQIARELGPFGITANSVAPGFVLSNPSSIAQWEALGTEGQARFLDALAVRRLGTPEDVALAVLFFASPCASYITGQTLSVDGGRWMLG
ncbi:MAG: SDR family NAD(P)-dependent oxidoreductase [Armatimonadota bacterium]|nr:SDR family NAD(P)-dependent oxidoreductase [Armatimonadota bacterium]